MAPHFDEFEVARLITILIGARTDDFIIKSRRDTSVKADIYHDIYSFNNCTFFKKKYSIVVFEVFIKIALNKNTCKIKYLQTHLMLPTTKYINTINNLYL